MSTIVSLSKEHTSENSTKEFTYTHPTLGVTCRFINGESFAFMESCPPGTYDAIVTDIPYNVLKDPKAKFDGPSFDIERFIPLARRVLADHGILITFCASLQLERLERLLSDHFDGGVRDGVWVKNDPSPKIWGPINAKENFVIAWPKIRTDIHNAGKAPWNVISSPKCHNTERIMDQDENKLHCTQKPVEMTARMLRRFVREGDHVFDPCAGTGAIGMACIQTGRNYTGIERETEYFNRGTEMFHDEKHMAMCAERAKRSETTHHEAILTGIKKSINSNVEVTDDQWNAIKEGITKIRGFAMLKHMGYTHIPSLCLLIMLALVVGFIAILMLKP